MGGIKKFKAVGKAPPQRIYADMDVCSGLSVILDEVKARSAVLMEWSELSGGVLSDLKELLSKDPNARIDWGLIEDFLAKQRMSRVMPYVLELRRWIFTNGQLLNALMLATEIYNTAIKYIDFVQNEMQKLIMIAKMAGCPICMKLSNYIAEYNKEYGVIINATNNYLTTINEWNNKCASQIHAEFCNKYFTVAKNVATVLKKHIDRSINDCY
jgi:hypothetical protein